MVAHRNASTVRRVVHGVPFHTPQAWPINEFKGVDQCSQIQHSWFDVLRVKHIVVTGQQGHGHKVTAGKMGTGKVQGQHIFCVQWLSLVNKGPREMLWPVGRCLHKAKRGLQDHMALVNKGLLIFAALVRCSHSLQLHTSTTVEQAGSVQFPELPGRCTRAFELVVSLGRLAFQY